MTNKIFCASLVGTQTRVIEIESAFTRGLPSFSITGLATSSIQESKGRVQSALANSRFTLPPLKINVNLFPSDIQKSGSYFDLPIALVLYVHSQQLSDTDRIWFAFGELGLDGSIKYTPSIYPLLFDLALIKPNSHIIVPKCAREILSVIPNLHLHFASSLQEALDIITTPSLGQEALESELVDKKEFFQKFGFSFLQIGTHYYYYMPHFALDFKEVYGQELAKRAALIASAGFHNIIFEGSPGCGKSMIAKRMRYILPPMGLDEMMYSLKLNSLDLLQALEYSALRPFRNPHQSASKASILGSATQFEPKPGEIALAHNGILFFDELPYFKRDILESLREPLENNKMTISRVHSKLEYDTSFLFVGAQNPCPCGNLLSTSKECRCQDKEITAYKNRLSEPFLDRIDMFVQMNEHRDAIPSAQELDSQSMFEFVCKAFVFAKNRGQKNFNGKLTESQIKDFCVLESEAENILLKAIQNFGLSLRAQNKLKKISRTIADLEQSDVIRKNHVLEALSFRKI